MPLTNNMDNLSNEKLYFKPKKRFLIFSYFDFASKFYYN